MNEQVKFDKSRFSPGDRVIRVAKSSRVPEGAKGTVLQCAPDLWGETMWEVEYDGLPCDDCGRPDAYPWAKSRTSWISRDTSIELTTEAALAKARAA